eukprot:TRINITY_DN19382_c0_g2_i1.p1 TRINITY_DN19382_c0_g2~~TRINITY_DN19382_c0_g2_i1.p1  ORF type:complete len:601 (-),score=79.27 TRINITY_DN19382_c0_g2_i1:381-2183(-)
MDAGGSEFEPVSKYINLAPRENAAKFTLACVSILVIELVERLCYYGFAGSQEFFLEELGYGVQQSAGINSAFTTNCYLWPLLGGCLADSFWGRYRTILFFASVYMLGMIVCTVASLPGALRSGNAYMVGAMGFLAFGTGGIKPNISNFGADQYDVRTEAGRRGQEVFYSYFYVAINLGSIVSYGGLTTLCSNGFPPFVPRAFGYSAAYGLGTAAMGLAVLIFTCNRRRYIQKPTSGNALLGVFMHVRSATGRGHPRGLAVFVGVPLCIVGILISVAVSFWGSTVLLMASAVSMLAGLVAVGWGCSGDLRWVNGAQKNLFLKRQETADFLRIMPVLISVTLAFNIIYNAMSFWYQLQACQMDLRIGSGTGNVQLNGSFFNVADCVCVVVASPILVKRRGAPLLPVHSHCAPAGVHMSSLSAWWMIGPYAVMGLAEVYINPTLYYLCYSQTPLRLRSTAAAINFVTQSASSGVFTLVAFAMGSDRDLNTTHLENGYFVSLALAVPFYICYVLVERHLVEKDFEAHTIQLVHEEDEIDATCAFKEVAFGRVGFFKDFNSPHSPSGSPLATPPTSPAMSDCTDEDAVAQYDLDGDDLVLVGADH